MPLILPLAPVTEERGDPPPYQLHHSGNLPWPWPRLHSGVFRGNSGSIMMLLTKENCPHYSTGVVSWAERRPLQTSAHQLLQHVEEFALRLSFTSCSTLKCGPCTSPGQHNRPSPNVAGVGKPTLKVWKQNRPHTSLITARGELDKAMLESSSCWWRQGRSGLQIRPTAAQTQN